MANAPYLSRVKTEMQRVTWPSKKETKDMSLQTIVILTIAGFILWALDTGIVEGLYQLSNLHIGS